MKKIKLIYLLVSLALLSSCESYLSELPDNRTVIDNESKIGELLVRAYPDADYMGIMETMSDNVFESGLLHKSNQTNTELYTWSNVRDHGVDTPVYYWNAAYAAIAQANHALNHLETLAETPETLAFKGEALVARAYCHFMLVNLWSKTYNPATSSQDSGIAYVTEVEDVLIKTYSRNSVAEVYDLIERDLLAGLELLDDQVYKEKAFHFNRAAARAFAARFYIFKGQWDKVLSYSEELGSFPQGRFRKLTVYNTLPYQSYMQLYSSANENANLLVSSVNSIYGSRSCWNDRFSLTGADRHLILGQHTNPFRKNWLYRPLSINGQITIAMPKTSEYFRITNPTANIGFPYITTILFSIEELFLNRIEAHIMTHQLELAAQQLLYFISVRTDNFDAKTDQLTYKQLLDFYPSPPDEFSPFYELSSQQRSLLKALTEMRRREFLNEGLRWLDIKRFQIVVTHDILNQSPEILEKNDLRRELQIPDHASEMGIPLNPRP